jgi:hypothetical protein
MVDRVGTVGNIHRNALLANSHQFPELFTRLFRRGRCKRPRAMRPNSSGGSPAGVDHIVCGRQNSPQRVDSKLTYKSNNIHLLKDRVVPSQSRPKAAPRVPCVAGIGFLRIAAEGYFIQVRRAGIALARDETIK